MQTLKSLSNLQRIGLALFLLGGAFLGLVGGLLGWFAQVLMLSVVLPAALLLVSYRIGLLMLIVLVPISQAQFLPKAGPISIVNVVLLGVCMAFVVRVVFDRMVGKFTALPLPKEVLLFFVIPVTLGFVIGSFHLSEIPPHMVARSDGKNGSLSYYWISLYLKNFLLVLAAYVVAVSVANFDDGKRYMIAIIVSSVFVVLAGVALFAISGQPLEAAVRSRQMFSSLGLHANDMAGLLLPPFGMALFMRDAARSWGIKLLLLLAVLILLSGVVLTGSRAGAIGLILVLGYYLVRQRRLGTTIFSMVLILGGLLLLPEAITDRLMAGIDSHLGGSARANFAAADDQLTSGRIFIYSQLLPDVLRSPLVGSGITSTLWSTYVRGGNVIGHPHNLYLSILLDLGLLGVLCFALYFIYVWRAFDGLSRDRRLPTEVNGFFAGALAGFLGYLGRGLGGGDAYPSLELWFIFVALGLAIGYRYRLPADADGGATQQPPALRVHAARAFWR